LNEWVELTVEIPGFRDDDSMPVFLAAMLSEALLADGDFTQRLWINRRFHWKLFVDVSIVLDRESNKANLILDFAALSATFISSTTIVTYNTSRTSLYSTSKAEVRA